MVSSSASLATGIKSKIENPHFFKTEQKALAKAQRKLSRLKKGSTEWQKAKKVVARIHEKIANRRHNFVHQVARKIVNNFGVICIEGLDIKDMQKDNFRRINRSIADAAWGQFAIVLSQKAEEAARQFIAVDPSYTSQRCSQCGVIVKKDLKTRWHDCPVCGCHLDRDLRVPYGSKNGDGITHPDIVGYEESSVEYDGDDGSERRVSYNGYRTDFTVQAGCPFCGCLVYDKNPNRSR